MADNYQALIPQWREKFLTLDILDKARQLELTVSGDSIYISYYNRDYVVSVSTGEIKNRRDPNAYIPHYDALFIYHLFWFSKENPKVSGEMIPFRDVKGAAVFDPAFQKLVLKPLAAEFNGRLNEFKAACESLGGEPISYGDAAYLITVCGKLKSSVIFWDGDDEFPATANILFDKNITDFTHVETVVTVGSDLAQAIIDAAGNKKRIKLV